MLAGAHALPAQTSTTSPAARDARPHMCAQPPRQARAARRAPREHTLCPRTHLVPPGSAHTSSQPHADGGAALCMGTTSSPIMSSSPVMAAPKAGAERCPWIALGHLLLPGVVGVVGITRPWGEGHLVQQPQGIRTPCPALLPMSGVTTGVRNISEEAAGASGPLEALSRGGDPKSL